MYKIPKLSYAPVAAYICIYKDICTPRYSYFALYKVHFPVQKDIYRLKQTDALWRRREQSGYISWGL